MKKQGKQLNSQNVFLIVAVLCLVAFLLFYFKVYMGNNDKASSLRNQNIQLNARITELQQYYQDEMANKERITELQEETMALIESFPSNVRPEDAIMTGVQIKDKADLTYTDITIAEAEDMFTVPLEDLTAADLEDYSWPIIYMKQDVAYNNVLDYPSLKDAIDAIFQSDYTANIRRISYSRDEESGKLQGTYELSFYYVIGNHQEYTAPDISSYLKGVTDIFQSTQVVEVPSVVEEAVDEVAE